MAMTVAGRASCPLVAVAGTSLQVPAGVSGESRVLVQRWRRRVWAMHWISSTGRVAR
ncbi:hypothetical protein SUDANB108_07101 [Streptomyces sp. enrichment culture]|uniref:hypothetical protein n=1 Tax=Streptomyces sp. enrichment culture TaxID=1795815 RepID=UPI003F577A42